MAHMEPMVHIIDDDRLARDSTAALVQSMGMSALAHSSVEAFLRAVHPDVPGCIVTDLRMPGLSGMDLLTELESRDLPLPVIMITAFARTHLTVKALRTGAITVLEKPCDDQVLWDAIRQAIDIDRAVRAQRARRREISERFALLTGQEQLVLERLLRGETNRQIAQALDVSTRTVEARRHNIFRKTQTGSIADLVALALIHRQAPGHTRSAVSQPVLMADTAGHHVVDA